MNKEKSLKNKYIGWDLSGTGTTAWFDGKNTGCLKSKNWLDHLSYISSIMKGKYGSYFLFEEMRKIAKDNQTSKDQVDLAQLIGAINIRYKKKYSFGSNMTAAMKKKLMINKKQLPDLVYKNGRGQGWFYKNKRINEHQVDAIIIFYYGRAKIDERYWF